MIGTLDDMKQNLYQSYKTTQGFNTFEQANLQTNLAYDKALLKTNLEMEDAVSQAYNSYLQQQQQINNSALGTGYKEALRNINASALENAYNTSLSNLATKQSEIEQGRTQDLNAINTALTEEAQMMQRYQTSHYDYLKWLYEKNPEDIFANDEWSQYLETVKDEYDNDVTQIMSFEDLRRTLVDDEGYLTQRGVDFFDQMEDALVGRFDNDYSFTSYLEQAYQDDKVTGQDLLNWMTSYNPYDASGNRNDVFRRMIGDNDNAWHKYERPELGARLDIKNVSPKRTDFTHTKGHWWSLIPKQREDDDINYALNEFKVDMEEIMEITSKVPNLSESLTKRIESLYNRVNDKDAKIIRKELGDDNIDNIMNWEKTWRNDYNSLLNDLRKYFE